MVATVIMMLNLLVGLDHDDFDHFYNSVVKRAKVLIYFCVHHRKVIPL